MHQYQYDKVHQEFRVTKIVSVLIYVAAPVFIIGGIYLILSPWIAPPEDRFSAQVYWFLLPLSIITIIVSICGVLDLRKYKIVITASEIQVYGQFSNRTLPFNEIKGYRLLEKHIIIEPKTQGGKKIKIGSYITNHNGFVQWVMGNFADADQLDINDENTAILNNSNFGNSVKERAKKLANAFTVAKVLNWSGWGILIWTIFLPKPFLPPLLAAALLPIITIAVVWYFKGLLKVNESNGSAHPSVLQAVIASSVTLIVKALFAFTIYDHSKIWIPAILIALVIFTLLLSCSNQLRFTQAREKILAITLSIFLSGYGYAVVVMSNCYFDKSQSKTFRVNVTGKRAATGETTTYYLNLGPWGPRTAVEEEWVRKDLYDQINVKDSVTIYFHEGLFRIPWIEITQ